ncbi:MAG TPA: hypothetical protein VIJ03_07040 [Candidatus Dormibacteraeota bacterium]
MYAVSGLTEKDPSEIVHPIHKATPYSYEVDSDWLGRFAARQAVEGLVVRAQIHTHAGKAFHSSTDDGWPMAATPEFVSIVVPRFGASTIPTDGLYVCVLQPNGDWNEIGPAEIIS